MRVHNDRILAENVKDIDFVLGGHDHIYVAEVSEKSGVFLVKSGTDFEEFSDIKVEFDVTPTHATSAQKLNKNENKAILYSKQKRMLVTVEKVQITNEFGTDPFIEKRIEKYAKQFNESLNRVVGYTDVALEGRFEKLRSQETNIANWMSDTLRAEWNDVDIALINCGTFRANSIIPKGEITARTIANILPSGGKTVVVSVPGGLIKQMLENSVAAYPVLEGRFGAISGLRFSFDPTKPAGSRVHSVKDLTGEPFDYTRKYNVATTWFLSLGKDGYTCFSHPECFYVRTVTDGGLLNTMIHSQLQKLSPGEDNSSPSFRKHLNLLNYS